VFDLRRMSNCSDPSRYQQSKLFELSIPDHLLHPTKSMGAIVMLLRDI
jgi:hypothetical protein